MMQRKVLMAELKNLKDRLNNEHATMRMDYEQAVSGGAASTATAVQLQKATLRMAVREIEQIIERADATYEG